MKVCARCGESKAHSAFHRQRRTADGYQSWCKHCKQEHAREHYVRNREARAAYNRKYRRAALRWFMDLKRDRPCTDCGNVFHPAAIQWDHLPGVEKIAHVAKLYTGKGARVLAEIDKCELVCANCHAIRTYERLHAQLN